ncbi:MAG: SbcC/MukB-like Walker B domain-containing protein [Lachnospiraceae bacterium]
MKQSKKIFSRMLINNWGGISHKLMEFHEYVNLFSGKSGSGKSTVMDAIQVVLYGSVASTFLNKAADDAKNKRSVLSYLRGAQKDGTSNRENVDFCSQIVLEITDTGSKMSTCIGVIFEVGKNDLDLKKYYFFSHSGKIPKDEYLTDQGTPYTVAQLKKLLEKRRNSEDNRGHMDINRIYPSKEAYLNTVYEVIFAHIDPGRLMTMEKSAIALRMTNGTGQFIKDYMFPKSKEDTVSTISEQLGAYREIKERVDDLEHRIEVLDEIHGHNQKLISVKADKVRTEALLRIIEIENCKTRLEAKEEDLRGILDKISQLEQTRTKLESEKREKEEELIEVKAKLHASDYGRKKKELEDMETTMSLLAGNSRQWREILGGLKAWDEDEDISGYVSNPTLQCLDEILDGEISIAAFEKLKRGIQNALELIEDELTELNDSIRKTAKELSEKKDMVEDLKNDRKPYRKELKSARAQLQSELSSQYGRTIHVEIFADLFDITDEKWKNAIEGRLGRIKHSLVTAPQYALDAAKIFRKMKRKEYEEVDLINTAAIKRDEPQAEKGTLYEAVSTQEPYVDLCLKRFLGRIYKCETVEELHEVRDGVTPDCYSYSNYIFRHLREADYNRYACIGTKVSKAKLKELEDEVYELQESQLSDMQMRDTLKRAQNFEQLNYHPEQLLKLSMAADELEKYLVKEEQLKRELKELEDGTLTAELTTRRDELEQEIEKQNQVIESVSKERIKWGESKGAAEKERNGLQEKLSILREGFVENETLMAEVKENLKTQSETVYRRKQNDVLSELSSQEETETEQRAIARNKFNREYPVYGFTGVEHDNDVYDRVLEQLRKDFEPKYKEEFEKQYRLVYHTLRENVIATIHGEIKAAYRHKREINRMLAKIRFSDSTYQIDILPAENENGQFYEMLMASELDSKVLDNDGFDGQLSFGEDGFYQKYEKQIQRLTEKFMPPRDEDGQKRSLHKQEMEKYADYRNYLTFSMYERVEDEQGNVKKNAVDEMAGRDSGGEGQNPKYVALLAGFAMLYMQQSNREPKIRLVLLDEAFSKMDKERSEVCLRYARELELQLIVCVPDERLQSLIRNVDSVYGFRRHQNQISMMHIDKGNYLEMVEGEKESEEIEEKTEV